MHRWTPGWSRVRKAGPDAVGVIMKAVFRRGLGVGAGVAVGGVIFVTLAATRPVPRKRPVRDTRPVVEVMTAEPTTHRAVVTGYGTVRPAENLTVVAEVDGQIVEKGPGVKAGALLEQGTLLFRIDDARLRAEIRRLEAQLATTDARLAELAEQERANRSLLEAEQRSHELARREHDREVELRGKEFATATDVEQAETKMNDRLLAVRQRRAALSAYGPQAARLKAEREAVLASKQSVEVLVGKTTVRAPYRCRVEEVNTSAFSFVRTGQQLASLYPVDAPFEVSVPLQKQVMKALYDLSRLERGRPPWQQTTLEARVRWDGPDGPQAVAAKVARVGAWLDATARTLEVILQIESPAERAEKGAPRGLIPGTFVRTDIRGRTFGDVLVIPEAALGADDTVFAVVEGRLKAIRISPVAVASGMVLVDPAEEIPAGSRIVLHEIEGGYDGMPVRVADAQAAAGARRKAERK